MWYMLLFIQYFKANKNMNKLNRLPSAIAAALRAFFGTLSASSYDYPTHNGINQKMVWNNRPSFSMRGVAQYETLKSARVANSTTTFPDLKPIFESLFTFDTVKVPVRLTDISGVGAAGQELSDNALDYVDLDQFVEEESMFYAADISMDNLQGLLKQCQKVLNKERTFVIYGWCDQLFHSLGDLSHRLCSAVYIARQLGYDQAVFDSIQFIRIEPTVLNRLNQKYQSFIVPKGETDYIESYLADRKIGYVAYTYDEYFPCGSYIYFVQRKDLPLDHHLKKKMINNLERVYTDFNRVLVAKYNVQKRNPILNKYLKIAENESGKTA